MSTEPGESAEPLLAASKTGPAAAPEGVVARLSGTELRSMAKSGGFAVDEQTGDRITEALNGILNTLEQRWERLQTVGRDPQLSSTPAARFVASHMVATAGDERGLLTQLQLAREEFPQYIEAVELAKRNYAEQELATRDTFSALNPEL